MSHKFDPNRAVLEVGTEGAPGSYGTDASTKFAVRPNEPLEVTEAINNVEQGAVNPTHDAQPFFTHEDKMEVSGTVDIPKIPHADSDQFPAISALIEAGGADITSAGGPTATQDTTATYTPTQSGYESATLKYLTKNLETGNWNQYLLKGYRGNVTYNFSLDSVATMDFEGQALYEIPTSESSPTLPTTINQGEDPFVAKNMTLSLGGSLETNITNFTFSPNMSTGSINSVEGMEKMSEAILTGGDAAGGSLDILATETGYTGTDGVWDVARNATELSWTITIDDGNGYKIDFTFPAVQLEPPSETDANGILRFDTSFRCNETNIGSGDSWEVKFTAPDSP